MKMTPMNEWWLRFKIYCTCSKQEVIAILVSAIVFGFMFSFRDYGEVGQTFFEQTSQGISSWGVSIILVLISLFVHEYAHKLAAISVGFKSTFKLSWAWLWGTLLLCIATAGHLVIPINGTIDLKLAGRQRIGHFRYGLNYWAAGIISLMGPLSNLVLAIIFKSLLILSPESIILEKALLINIALAVFNILPFPKVDGLQTLFGERMFYIFIATIVIITGFLLLLLNPIQAILASLFAGLLVFGIYFYFENR